METTINERIKKIISYFNYRSVRAFAMKIGVAQPSLNDVINGAEPKFSTLEKILKAEPTINSEWLIKGIGEVEIKEDGKKFIEIIAGKNLNIEELRKEYLRLLPFENHIKYLTDLGNTYSTKEIAAEIDMTAINLNKYLEEHGIICKESDKWILCDEYIGNDYQKPYSFDSTNEYMRWTAKGRFFIYSLFKDYSIAAEPISQYGNTYSVIEELKNHNLQYKNDIEWYKKEIDKKQDMIDTLMAGNVIVQKNVS